MSVGVREHIENLLKDYPERERKIALLHYELEHATQMSGNEMIGTMALGHGESVGHSDSYISDKTLYIALNYQLAADKLNTDIKKEIVDQLMELERKQKKVDYYISLLDKRQAKVIRLIYKERLSQGEVEEIMGISAKTVRKL